MNKKYLLFILVIITVIIFAIPVFTGVSLLESCIVFSAFITLTLPYIEQRIRDKKLTLDWLLGLFFFASVLTFIGGIWGLYRSSEATRETMNANNKIMSSIAKESQHISPSDFQLQLVSTRYPRFPKNWQESTHTVPAFQYVIATLDSAYFTFVLTYVPSKGQSPGGRNPNEYYRYFSHDLAFSGLDHYPYLESLMGDTVRFRLLISELEFAPGIWTHYVDFYIKGRHFRGDSDSLGIVTIALTLR